MLSAMLYYQHRQIRSTADFVHEFQITIESGRRRRAGDDLHLLSLRIWCLKWKRVRNGQFTKHSILCQKSDKMASDIVVVIVSVILLNGKQHSA
jgi:hypothetical protein